MLTLLRTVRNINFYHSSKLIFYFGSNKGNKKSNKNNILNKQSKPQQINTNKDLNSQNKKQQDTLQTSKTNLQNDKNNIKKQNVQNWKNWRHQKKSVSRERKQDQEKPKQVQIKPKKKMFSKIAPQSSPHQYQTKTIPPKIEQINKKVHLNLKQNQTVNQRKKSSQKKSKSQKSQKKSQQGKKKQQGLTKIKNQQEEKILKEIHVIRKIQRQFLRNKKIKSKINKITNKFIGLVRNNSQINLETIKSDFQQGIHRDYFKMLILIKTRAEGRLLISDRQQININNVEIQAISFSDINYYLKHLVFSNASSQQISKKLNLIDEYLKKAKTILINNQSKENFELLINKSKQNIQKHQQLTQKNNTQIKDYELDQRITKKIQFAFQIYKQQLKFLQQKLSSIPQTQQKCRQYYTKLIKIVEQNLIQDFGLLTTFDTQIKTQTDQLVEIILNTPQNIKKFQIYMQKYLNKIIEKKSQPELKKLNLVQNLTTNILKKASLLYTDRIIKVNVQLDSKSLTNKSFQIQQKSKLLDSHKKQFLEKNPQFTQIEFEELIKPQLIRQQYAQQLANRKREIQKRKNLVNLEFERITSNINFDINKSLKKQKKPNLLKIQVQQLKKKVKKIQYISMLNWMNDKLQKSLKDVQDDKKWFRMIQNNDYFCYSRPNTLKQSPKITQKTKHASLSIKKQKDIKKTKLLKKTQKPQKSEKSEKLQSEQFIGNIQKGQKSEKFSQIFDLSLQNYKKHQAYKNNQFESASQLEEDKIQQIKKVITPILKTNNSLFFNGVVQQKVNNFNETNNHLDQEYYSKNKNVNRLVYISEKTPQSNLSYIKNNNTVNSFDLSSTTKLSSIINENNFSEKLCNSVLFQILTQKNIDKLNQFVTLIKKINPSFNLKIQEFNQFLQQEFKGNLNQKSIQKITSFHNLINLNPNNPYLANFNFSNLFKALHEARQFQTANSIIKVLLNTNLVDANLRTLRYIFKIVLQQNDFKLFIRVLQNVNKKPCQSNHLETKKFLPYYLSQTSKIKKNKIIELLSMNYQSYIARRVHKVLQQNKLKKLTPQNQTIYKKLIKNPPQIQIIDNILQNKMKIKHKFKIIYEVIVKQLFTCYGQKGTAPFATQNLQKIYEVSRNTFNILNLLILAQIAYFNKKYKIVFDSYYLLQKFKFRHLKQRFLESIIDSSTNHKILQHNLFKTKLNPFIKIKTILKFRKDLKLAYSTFNEQIYKPLIKILLKQKVKIFMLILLSRRGKSQIRLTDQQINKLVKNVRSSKLISLYMNEQNYLFDKTMQEKFTDRCFWKNIFHEKRVKQMIQLNKQGIIQQRWVFPSEYSKQTTFPINYFISQQLPVYRVKEQVQFQYKKKFEGYLLELEAILQEHRILPEAIVLKKLMDLESTLQDQNMMNVLTQYSLYPLDLQYKKQYSLNFIQKIDDIRNNDYNYNVILHSRKPLLKQAFYNVNEAPKSQKNTQFITQLIKVYPRIWKEAENYVNIPLPPPIQDLMFWGIDNQQPMAIYMAEQIATVTKQIIPDGLAQRVSHMLSYKREISDKLENKCKNALSLVGKIDRSKIYNFNIKYEHIFRNLNYERYLQKLQRKKYPTQFQIFKQRIKSPVRWQNWQVDDKMAFDSILKRANSKISI